MICDEILAAARASQSFYESRLTRQRLAFTPHQEEAPWCIGRNHCRLVIDANRNRINKICCNHKCSAIMDLIFPATNTIWQKIRAYCLIPPGPCDNCLICARANQSGIIGICTIHRRRMQRCIEILMSSHYLLRQCLLPEIVDIITELVAAII